MYFIYIIILYMFICVICLISKRSSSLGQVLIEIKHKVKKIVRSVKT